MSTSARGCEFRPLPLLGNAHVQTLLGSFWRGVVPRFGTRERHVALPDGDRLVLHDSVPANWQPGRCIVLLVHGLGGTHRSGYMVRLAGLLVTHGLRAVRIDLRGCGRGTALARKTYNGACSEDLRAALAEMHAWDPSAPLIVIGFSLGGNIALKLAGEAAQHPVPGLERVATVAPPIDLIRCAALLALPRNRWYNRYFTAILVRQVRRHRRHFVQLRPVQFPRRLTVQMFDEIYTAPEGGFADAMEYYRRASSLPIIGRIAVPTLILAARDDPFIAVEPFESLAGLAGVEVQIVQRGGHCGFLGWDGAGGIRWAERRVANWVLHYGQEI
ncbi:MAG TPA: alpha/beta fold hydrolase [Gemmataceae bacterium]|nr:alpha/beta fold hydrolase [Gemmataceae bacterium]